MLRKDKSLRWLTRKRVIVPRGRALIAEPRSKHGRSRLLAVVFLNHLDRGTHVASYLKHADAVAQRIYGIEMSQAIDRIFFAEGTPLYTCLL